MTDKEKFRKEVEKLKSSLIHGACSSQIAMETRCKEDAYNEVLAILDTMQEEPVSMWHDPSKETPTQGSNILMVRKEEEDTNFPPIAGCFHGTNSRLDGRNWGYYNGFCYNEIEPPIKWAYIDDILNLSNVERTVKNWKEPISEDLEEEIVKRWKVLHGSGNPTPFDTFNGIACHFANWQKQQDQSTIELAEDHAMLAGMEKMKEQMMAKAIDGYVIKDVEEGNGDFLLSADYLPKSMGLKDQQRVKVIVIKEG